MESKGPQDHHFAPHIERIEDALALDTSAQVAQVLQRVDDKEAGEIQQSLQRSKQGGYVPLTAEERAHHRALNRKFDFLVLPFCVLVYLFNGLDRSNIGNAATNGFTTDLHMPADAVNTATTLFFCTFVPLQPVSVAIGKRVGQAYWLSFIAFGWGILILSHAFIKTESQLIGIRLLIGVFEAGFYPTTVSYLSLFYPRFDLAFRTLQAPSVASSRLDASTSRASYGAGNTSSLSKVLAPCS